MTGGTFWVSGVPAPQGSKNTYRTKSGKTNVVESSKAVKPWRNAVHAAAAAAVAAGDVPSFGRHVPVRVDAVFVVPRPKVHWSTGNERRVKDSFRDVWPAVKPDVDKYLRASLDALTTSGVLHDDGQVVSARPVKVYEDEWTPVGASFVLRREMLCPAFHARRARDVLGELTSHITRG